MAKNDFPYKAKDLYFDALKVLEALGGKATADTMLAEIIKRKKILAKDVKLPHVGKVKNMTELEYQFNWARTRLKNSGHLIKIGKIWKLTERGLKTCQKESLDRIALEEESAKGEKIKDVFYVDLFGLKEAQECSYTKGNETVYFRLLGINIKKDTSSNEEEDNEDVDEGGKQKSKGTRGKITYQRSEIGPLTSTAKVEEMNRQYVERLALALAWNKTVDVAALFSDVKDKSMLLALEGMFANSSHVFVGKGMSPRQIFWNPKVSHRVGEVVESDLLPEVDSNRKSSGKTSIESKMRSLPVDTPYQEIVYGAPGVGKSYRIKNETEGYETIRTTFHPDSDYATFVGAYKPSMEEKARTALDGTKLVMADVNGVGESLKKEKVIIYDFIPQAFVKAYVKAWKKFAAGEAVFLVIEEINRGNCAQIFGDLFQLLDRGEDGFSEYPIEADADLEKYLLKEFAGLEVGSMGLEEGLALEVKSGKKLVMPSNLYLRATMNTSDQSLFPIDSAFKRRWDWVYVPICAPEEGGFVARQIVADGKKFDWYCFITKVNEVILGTLKNTDKQMGYFFVKAPGGTGEITAARFAEKVLFYLFTDVFKDWDLPKEVFGKGEDGFYKFGDFFDGKGGVKEEEVAAFLSHILGEGESAAGDVAG